MSAAVRFFLVQSVLNLLIILNAISFIPLMIGQEVRSWWWAAAYFVGYTIIGTISAFLQIVVMRRAAARQGASVSLALAVPEVESK